MVLAVGVGKELSADEGRYLNEGHSYMEIQSKYSSFKITRKEDELKDEKFPDSIRTV